MDKSFKRFAGRLGVRIMGRSKYLLRTIAVDAMVNHQLYLFFPKASLDTKNVKLVHNYGRR